MSAAIPTRPIPPLRFPDFNDEGEDRKLTDLCHRIGDGIHSTPIYSDSGDCHFINGNNLNGGTIKIEPKTKRVDLEEAKKHQRPLSDDTILLSINGTIGNIAVYRQEQVILGKSACYINVNDRAASKHYIYSFLGTERVRYYFESELTGSTIKNLSLAAIRNLHLHLPTLPEQRKIANFLTSVDERIQQLIQKKALLEDYKKGVMQQLFTQAIRFKDDHGNEFPDWEEKKLGEVLTIGSGRDYKHLGKGDVPVYGSGGVMTYVDNYLYQGESVGIGRKGTIDKPRLLEGAFWTVDTLFYTHSFKRVLPRFIYAVFQRINWKAYNEAGGVPSLSKSTIESIPISVPDKAEQTKIADFLSAIDRKIENAATQIIETQTFKKGLLQQMFV